jgi:hypothetical protein
VIPLPVILVEFLLAFGAALFIAQAVAIVQLRRDGNWPPTRPVGPPNGASAAPGGDGAADRVLVPSRVRIVTLLAIGLGVSLWALATLVHRVAL